MFSPEEEEAEPTSTANFLQQKQIQLATATTQELTEIAQESQEQDQFLSEQSDQNLSETVKDLPRGEASEFPAVHETLDQSLVEDHKPNICGDKVVDENTDDVKIQEVGNSVYVQEQQNVSDKGIFLRTLRK